MMQYGSDHIIDILIDNNIKYVSCNPGASFRGLHDSIVNYEREDKPQLILCCHEEIAIAIAHGYAKASGHMMAVFIHANIGLQHATMAIFNAWCDRVPMLIVGGVGPLAANLRRPWIDWIHTSQHHSNIIGGYIKWEDQPHNLTSALESLRRACRISNMIPKAPVYVAIDSSIQEEAANEILESDRSRYLPPKPPTVDQSIINEIAGLLIGANNPLIIVDQLGRNQDTVQYLVELVELLKIPVFDCGGKYNFPNHHELCITGMSKNELNKIDFILAFDVDDLSEVLGGLSDDVFLSYIPKTTKIAHITMADYLISSWVADYYKLYPVDYPIAADSYKVLVMLLELCRTHHTYDREKIIKRHEYWICLNKKLKYELREFIKHSSEQTTINVPFVISEIWSVIKNEKWVLVNGPSVPMMQWVWKIWNFTEENSYLGDSGGAGLGYGLGASIGAALAYKDSNKICVNLQTDGDFLFTPSALWTAAHYEVPLLIIMMNNNSYQNTKEHAKQIAKNRNRCVDNAVVGSDLVKPIVNFPELARSFDIKSFDTVKSKDDLKVTIMKAIDYIKTNKKTVLVDIVIEEGTK